MSAFCVYGMTITHAMKLAEKRLERGHDCKTKEEWKEKVGEVAETILVSHAPVQVSPTFGIQVSRFICLALSFGRDACRTIH